jgi:drug/metabolite transporter (DMT)-like permease
MNASMFLFTLNNVFGKEAMNREIGFATFVEFTFVRMWIMALASYIWLVKLKIRVTDVPQDLKLILLARCFLGSVNFLVIAIALKTLPLSISTIIMSTNPFMTALLQYFWTKQMITVYDGVSMVGSFIGIIVIGLTAPKASDVPTSESDAYLLGIICSVACAVFLSFIFVATSRMKSIHYLVISFYLGVCSGCMSIVGMVISYLVDGRLPFHGMTLIPWLELLGAGLTNFLGINYFTLSFQQGMPATTAILGYIQVFYNYLADLAFF